MKNRLYIKIIKLILLFSWLSFIFYMSNQNGTTSGNLSTGIFEKVINIIPKIAEKKDFYLFLIRKSAHIFEYFILGILIFLNLKEYIIDVKKLLITSILLSILFSSFDEIHQLFIDGRTGKITDVLIDSIGYIISILISHFINLKKIKL